MAKARILLHFLQFICTRLTYRAVLCDNTAMANPFLTTNLRLTETDYTTIGNNWSYLATYFPYYRIYYITSGSAKMFLFDETLELKPRHLYFIPAYSITGAECNDSMSHYWMHFNLDATTASYLTIYKPLHCLPASQEDETVFRLIKENFEKSDNGNDSPRTLACVSLAKYLFSKFLPSESISAEAANFLPVLEYIDGHLTEKITNAQLSGIMCLNETYFSNVFSKQFGVSPKQYVLQKRIGAAANMLIETDKTVKEIAFRFGYENEMYFNRMFRKLAGAPPGEYRRRFRSK